MAYSTPYFLSWAFSILVHGLILGSAIILMTADLRLASQSESFQWDVSILESSQQARQSAPSQPHVSPTPQVEPEPVAQAVPQEVRTVAPTTQAAPQPVRSEPHILARTAQPIETPPPTAMEQPAAAAIQPTPAVPAPSEAVARMPESDSASGPSPASPAQAKRDYGWLTETLWSRIEQLKRYPSLARLNRWEGKVVVRAVIKETGDMADLRIAQSSGYDILDQDALETLKQTAPLKLKQPLGQPQIVVHIPISYKLDR